MTYRLREYIHHFDEAEPAGIDMRTGGNLAIVFSHHAATSSPWPDCNQLINCVMVLLWELA
tara:strand:+ start:195 stop:377 length:183 start_codon:yes stop_codon:yes gene_type:complete